MWGCSGGVSSHRLPAMEMLLGHRREGPELPCTGTEEPFVLPAGASCLSAAGAVYISDWPQSPPRTQTRWGPSPAAPPGSPGATGALLGKEEESLGWARALSHGPICSTPAAVLPRHRHRQRLSPTQDPSPGDAGLLFPLTSVLEISPRGQPCSQRDILGDEAPSPGTAGCCGAQPPSPSSLGWRMTKISTNGARGLDRQTDPSNPPQTP